ncbi:MAG: NDP-sugar synthase [Sphingobacteriales bacterium]|jgi:NDP-sugar pyrophosphorylase family protein
MKPTLLILAAGMASRYGGMKQIESFGPSGETIMDYSIYDAIRAGFGKVVFIIREEFAENFKNIFEPKLKGKVETAYVYQDLHAFLGGRQIPAERTKPWGTAHAVLCAKDAVHEPFAVINADDFYGKDAFDKAYQFLTTDCNNSTWSIIGYHLLNTLSDHGTVNRGVCELDKEDNLVSVRERLNIHQKDGQVVCDDNQEPHVIPSDSKVSMNFWCFSPGVFDYSENLFNDFLDAQINVPKSEFFIPIVADSFIKSGSGEVRVIGTSASWFGVTYKEDAPAVKDAVNKLVAANQYPTNLWQLPIDN